MEPVRRAEHYPLFDAMRGIASLLVITVHTVYQPSVAAGVNDLFWRWGVHFDIAVPVFFGLSGFLIYRPFASARAKRSALPNVREYAIRRVLRIVPIYWLVLIVVGIWIGLPGVFTAEGLPKYFLFVHVYDMDTAIKPYIIGQTWTLDVEALFYVLLPVLALLVLRRQLSFRTELAMIAGLAFASVIWTAFSLRQIDRVNTDSLPYLLSLPNQLLFLCAGMFLAVLSVHSKLHAPPPLARFERSGGLCLGVAAAFWVAACVLGTDGASIESDREYFFSHLCYAGVAFFVVLAGVWGDPKAGWARGKLLSSRVLGYLGTISLSLYLIHLAVMDQLGRWLHLPTDAIGWNLLQWAGWWAAVVAASVALASIGFWLVERPCMNWRRRKPPPPGAPEEERADRVPGYAGAPA